MKIKLIPKVTSLYDLATKAASEPRYVALAIVAAKNLGYEGMEGREILFSNALNWLKMNANETDEDGVVDEINFVRDCV